MGFSDLHLRLLNRLREKGQRACGAGIDLGTTKSALAWALFDPGSGELTCRNFAFETADGGRSIALPSAVAEHDGQRLFGSAALALRGRPRVLPDRDLFTETKNLIGLRHSYRDAPADLHDPTDVAAALLRHMREQARDGQPFPALPPLVVTVPASFHATQRQATLDAAARAFDFEGHDRLRLLDEPCAAFIDLNFRQPRHAASLLREGANVLVFDFGGGTCDVAIFRIDSAHGGTMCARLRACSRYHRLGGGDIDRALVHDVLIPQWREQHGIDAFALSWHDKRHVLEPQLLAAAEHLKVALSMRLAELRRAGLEPAAGMACEAVAVPVLFRDRAMPLSAPSLSLQAMDAALAPLLDPEPPPESGDEFVLRSSAHSPVLHALLRARLDPAQIHGILLCGSSSLLPRVQDSLRRRFPDAEHALLGDAEDLQGAMARGAALQALSLQVLGEPVLTPVASCDVSLKLDSGEVALCRAGDAVPSTGPASTLLRPPRDSSDGVDIAVELQCDGKRSAGRSLWFLPAPVRSDEPLRLSWRMDANQCIELRLERCDHEGTEPFVQRFDAPIMHRDPAQAVRARLLEREERIRNDRIAREDFGTAFEQHAHDCASLGEYEKALHYLSLAMQEQGERPELMIQRGIWRERMGNQAGAVESYQRAADCPSARFNLALLHHNAGRNDEALHWVDLALSGEPKRGYHALRGDILDRLGQREEARREWQDAIDGQPQLHELDDWSLGWMERAAAQIDNTAMRDKLRRHRAASREQDIEAPRQGELPARLDISSAQAA